ncbi:hypothetical protein SKAU_G00352060 [Synaphobranchus kaupii]|uniref:Uncharacterized protein n=1 Tax=Synaphobranchus kaupii TaxID=118154 RepID=A0A9Q1IG39_SYNKA|nr:hypothetical protein SKAU_G00352060 [Synaphobranchus kaupii]
MASRQSSRVLPPPITQLALPQVPPSTRRRGGRRRGVTPSINPGPRRQISVLALLCHRQHNRNFALPSRRSRERLSMFWSPGKRHRGVGGSRLRPGPLAGNTEPTTTREELVRGAVPPEGGNRHAREGCRPRPSLPLPIGLVGLRSPIFTAGRVVRRPVTPSGGSGVQWEQCEEEASAPFSGLHMLHVIGVQSPSIEAVAGVHLSPPQAPLIPLTQPSSTPYVSSPIPAL